MLSRFGVSFTNGDDSRNKAECLFEVESMPAFLWSRADNERAILSFDALLHITRESDGYLSGETF